MKFSRTPVIVASVVVFHLAGLWALHQGLLQRMVEVVVPVMVISQSEPPPPPPKPPDLPKPVEPPKPEPLKPVPLTPPPKILQPVLTPALPVASPEPPAVLSAPTAAPTAPAVQAAPPAPPPPAPPPAPPAPVAPPKVELPSSKADYLHNPPPDYPRMSKRLGEQGRVVVKVLIGEDGQPQKAELQTSSGFERLDKSALEVVMRWRYVPGKRGGVAEAMWYQVPIQFTLE